MKKFLLALLLSLLPVMGVAREAMSVNIRCSWIDREHLTMLCNTTNLYRYPFDPLWVIKDYRGRVSDQVYGSNSVVIFPPAGPFSLEIYRVDGGGVQERIIEGRFGFGASSTENEEQESTSPG